MAQNSTEQCPVLNGDTFSLIAYSLISLSFAIIISLINISALLILTHKLLSTKKSDRSTLYQTGFFIGIPLVSLVRSSKFALFMILLKYY